MKEKFKVEVTDEVLRELARRKRGVAMAASIWDGFCFEAYSLDEARQIVKRKWCDCFPFDVADFLSKYAVITQVSNREAEEREREEREREEREREEREREEREQQRRDDRKNKSMTTLKSAPYNFTEAEAVKYIDKLGYIDDSLLQNYLNELKNKEYLAKKNAEWQGRVSSFSQTELKKCPNCGQGSKSNAKFCANCGYAFYVKCPSCSSMVKNGSKFCSQCGTRIENNN